MKSSCCSTDVSVHKRDMLSLSWFRGRFMYFVGRLKVDRLYNYNDVTVLRPLRCSRSIPICDAFYSLWPLRFSFHFNKVNDAGHTEYKVLYIGIEWLTGLPYQRNHTVCSARSGYNKNISKFTWLAFRAGNPMVNSLHKRPIMWKDFSSHDFISIFLSLDLPTAMTGTIRSHLLHMSRSNMTFSFFF